MASFLHLRSSRLQSMLFVLYTRFIGHPHHSQILSVQITTVANLILLYQIEVQCRTPGNMSIIFPLHIQNEQVLICQRYLMQYLSYRTPVASLNPLPTQTLKKNLVLLCWFSNLDCYLKAIYFPLQNQMR